MRNVKLYIFLAILGAVLVVGGTSYAILTLVIEGTNENELILGTLSLNLTESNSVTLSNTITK